MRKTAALGVLAALSLLSARSAWGDVRLMEPTRGARMWLPVGGKSRLYFRVESGDTAALKVRGPGEIKCIVRAIPRTTTATIAYSIAVTEGNHVVKTVRTETSPGTTKWKGSDETAAKSRSFTLSVADGEHVFNIAFKSKDAKAAGIRYAFRNTPARPSQAPVSAVSKRESVTLLVKEKPLDYYVADSQSPVEVNVIGPTRLRVVSRLICPSGARGNQQYILKLQRDGKSLADRPIVTTKSGVVESEAHPAWILGKSRTFYVDIPKGTHVVRLWLSNADAPGVALRFSIPREDTANGR